MNLKKIILLILFFAVLCTSLFPQNIYALVLFSLSTFLLLPFKKWWDRSCIALLIFSVFYVTMVVLGDQVNSGFLAISYLVTPVAFYRFGHYLMMQYQNEKERFRLLLFIGSAYLINVFILTVFDISIVGIVNTDRTLLGTSMDDEALVATIYGLMTSVGIGCLGACFSKQLKGMRVFYMLLVGMSMLTVIHLINRGGIIVLIFSLFISILLYYRKKNVQLLFISLIIFIVCFLIINSGLISDDILNAYQRRNELEKYGAMTAGGRTDLWQMSIKNMLINPLGWTQEEYAHNLWLDLAKIGGWISLAPFLAATFFAIKNLMKVGLKSRMDFSKTIAVLGCALILAASIEPVIEASMLFFALLMLIWGITDAIWSQERRSILR